MAIIPITQRLADIEEQGRRLCRRIEKLEGDRDFLIDTIIDRPWVKVEAQRHLIEEWNEEIERSKVDLQFLRDEWTRRSCIKNKTSHKKQKI